MFLTAYRRVGYIIQHFLENCKDFCIFRPKNFWKV